MRERRNFPAWLPLIIIVAGVTQHGILNADVPVIFNSVSGRVDSAIQLCVQFKMRISK